MKHKCMVTYEYPVEHKPPVLAEIYLHGDKVQTRDIEPIYVNPAIEELEKIKAEISAKQDEFIHSNLLSECNVRYGLNIAEIIIDKHITELKGEQNGNN